MNGRTPAIDTFVLAGLLCCGPSEDSQRPSGSQQMIASEDYARLYVADPERGSIAALNPHSGELHEIEVQGEPTRLSRARGKIFATLRNARQVLVLRPVGAQLVEEDRISVGAEPFGVISHPSEERIYVSVSLEDRVLEIDSSTHEVLRSFQVPGQPRWLAIHPSEESLYVGPAFGDRLFRIDLDSHDVVPIRLPERGFHLKEHRTFDTCGREALRAKRITGDLAVSPNGRQLLVPALYVDNVSEVERGLDSGAPTGFSTYGPKVFVPVIASYELDGGVPIAERPVIIELGAFGDRPLLGYPATVAVSPDSSLVLAAIEAGSGVIAFPLLDKEEIEWWLETEANDLTLNPAFTPNSENLCGVDGRPEQGGISAHFRSVGIAFSQHQLAIQTDRGPKSFAFTDESEVYVYAFIDRTVSRLDLQPPRVALLDPGSESPRPPPFGGPVFTSGRRIPIASAFGTPEVELGRRLFFSADDGRMADTEIGVSCGTCHFDLRNDGLTWSFTDGKRQTPSLLGRASATHPVRWDGAALTVADEAARTSFVLMGGVGISEQEAQTIQAFVDTARAVDPPLKGTHDPRVARGSAIFSRPDVGCAGCHYGDRYTDNEIHSMFGLENVNTPALTGVAATPPYLHDGRAATLREMLELVRDGSMGNTSSLTQEELSDLEAYLLSL